MKAVVLEMAIHDVAELNRRCAIGQILLHKNFSPSSSDDTHAVSSIRKHIQFTAHDRRTMRLHLP